MSTTSGTARPRCLLGSRHRKDHCDAFETPSPCRVSRLHEQRHRGLSEPKASRHPRQPQPHKKNEDWLKAHPNVKFHFTPTSASWLNQVEVWFSILWDSHSAALPLPPSSSLSSISMTTSKHITSELSPSSGPRKRSVNAASNTGVSLSHDSGY